MGRPKRDKEMTEDEQAELLSFTGISLLGKQYVEFEDFDRLRKWIRDILRAQEAIKAAIEKRQERKKDEQGIIAALDNFQSVRNRLWSSDGSHCKDWSQAAWSVYTAALKYERDFEERDMQERTPGNGRTIWEESAPDA